MSEDNAHGRARGRGQEEDRMKHITAGGFAAALAIPLLAAANPLSGVLGRLAVRPAVRHGNLTVFPLVGATGGSGSYLTLDKAIARGRVEVQEKDGGDVNLVRVRNTSNGHVFGLAGEIITGAKQNRMLERDVLLPPNSGWLELPVYCVEHGRWHGETMEFSSKGQVAAGRVRGRAANTRDQSEVWAEISANKADLGVAAPTSRFDAVFEDRNVQDEVRGYRAKLESQVPALAPGAVGVAVAVGGRFVCVDVFGSPALFRALWPRLLESYVVDALAGRPAGAMTADDVRAVLRDAASAAQVARPSVGVGQAWRIEGTAVTGSALVRGKEVVHLDLFPAEDGGATPLRLDIRRPGGIR
ncbi:MAG: DUF6569 family protein [bacterium]